MRKLIGGAVVLVLIAVGACVDLPSEVQYDCIAFTQDTSATMADGDTIRDTYECTRTQP